jgi:hypothetical protein
VSLASTESDLPNEVVSHSKWGASIYAGTGKSKGPK